MALSRSAIVRGPGCLFWNPGASQIAIPVAGGITAELAVKEAQLAADHVGEFDVRTIDVEAKISATPVGLLTADILGVLFPTAFRNPTIGASVFGASDTPCLVHSKAGTKMTFHACAVTKMPSLILSAAKPLYGGMEITAIRKNNTEWTDAAALYTKAAASFSEPAMASADAVTQAYSAAWGDVFTALHSEDGWTVDFTANLKPDPIDAYGTNDYLIDGVTAIAKCRPKNLDETLIDALLVQGASAAIGGSRRRGKNLVITGGDLTVTLYDAVLQKGPLRWGRTEVRAGEIAFAAQRAESTGTYGALFALALA